MTSEKALALTTGVTGWQALDTFRFQSPDGKIGIVEISGDEYIITVNGEHVFQGWEEELEEIDQLTLQERSLDMLQYNVNDRVIHSQYGTGTIIRKTGPTFVQSCGDWMEASYLVEFDNGCYIPSLYFDELGRIDEASHDAKRSQLHHQCDGHPQRGRTHLTGGVDADRGSVPR